MSGRVRGYRFQPRGRNRRLAPGASAPRFMVETWSGPMNDTGEGPDAGGTEFLPERLREVADGDPDAERELMDLFLSELTERIAAVEALLADGPLEAIRLEAHGLKGSSGNIGAVGIQGI